jgi:hypothetical protein
VLVVLLAGIVTWIMISPGTPAVPRGRALTPAPVVAARRGLAAAEAGLMPWHLTVPISREAAVAGPGNRLIIMGGLTAGGASASGIYAVRTATGAARYLGALSAPRHDAAAAVIGGHTLIFGGGSQVSIATVQSFVLPGQGAHAPATTATTVGSLPMPRSDVAGVTIGRTAYLAGGYDGSRPDAAVLATTNGRNFTTVARLPVPVRYPAVAALAGQVFVFGGQAVTGPHAGAPVDVIQAINPARHSAAVIGHLPEPLTGAVAVTVGGELFVAGGQSPAAHPPVPGLGMTQLSRGETSRGAGTEASSSATTTVSTIWAFDPATKRLLPAGHLQVPVSHAAVAVTGATAWIIGGESGGALVAAVQMLRPDRAFGTAGAPGAGSPYFGARLLIADRGNNRLLLLDPSMHVVWKYPSAAARRDPLGFYFPDDAFFTDRGTAIISNQEQNDTIVKIAYPSGKIIWSYGHPRRRGIPARTRRRLPAQERPGHRGGRRQLPRAGHQRQRHRRAPDRHHRRVRAQPAGLAWLAER